MLLRSVFTIFRGIGPHRAHLLRSRGYRTWSDLLNDSRQLSLFADPLTDEIVAAEEAHSREDATFFYDRLPRKLAYLLALDFPNKVTFLDIEATGLSRIYHEVTLVGLSQETSYQFHLAGRKGVPPEISNLLAARPVVVTFNGTLYDLPFLHTRLRLPRLLGVDLRYLAFRLGFSGSQKHVEEAFSLHRPTRLRGMVGEDAPALWFRAVRGDLSAMRRLIEYNYEDVRGLARLLPALAGRAVAADAISHRLPARTIPRPPRQPLLPRTTLASLTRSVAHDASPLVKVASLTSHPRVVGIDLTGSSKRPTGAAVMTGRHVDVAMLGTDDLILEYVRNAKPDLVSIDAPLSLPFGRSSVTDDDPARQTAGIMRVAERELKRRGVNVYPCLLPSMQLLTERGMRLAAAMRAEGFPVIECYPGAAQDMLAMPRKGVGIEYLRQSLQELGVQVPARRLSHDELDAITAAIVGMLFLDARYELLGTDDEEPMVVPQLHPRDDLPEAVVVATGPISAGKTTLSEVLASSGWAYTRYSSVIADEVAARGLTKSRDTLQRVGEELRAARGQRWIGRRVLASVRGASRIVVDGARFPEDLAFLHEEFPARVYHVHVDAPREMRKQRSLLLGVSPEDFARAEQHILEGETQRLGQTADRVLINSGTLGDFTSSAAELAVLASSHRERLFTDAISGRGFKEFDGRQVGVAAHPAPVD